MLGEGTWHSWASGRTCLVAWEMDIERGEKRQGSVVTLWGATEALHRSKVELQGEPAIPLLSTD